MTKPIKSGPEFEASFPVRGRVLHVIMCDCEEEGDIRIRVARNPAQGWAYDPKDAESFIDIHGYDTKGAVEKVRAGEWAEGRVVCFGYLKRTWARRIEFPAGILGSGSRLTGLVHVDGDIEIDFGLFRARLAFEDDSHRDKVMRGAGIRDGSFVASDVSIDIELKRWGRREEILRR